jgi:hypothetical protein
MVSGSIARMLEPSEQLKVQNDLQKFVSTNSLSLLISRLFEEIE